MTLPFELSMSNNVCFGVFTVCDIFSSFSLSALITSLVEHLLCRIFIAQIASLVHAKKEKSTTAMSLVADYSSTEGESSGEEDAQITTIRSEKPKTALPSANMLFTGGRAGEVFNNPYKEAEDAKLASLEQHVKMVNTKETMLKGDKKICWNYRKGRCRFGSNCSFVHDSDLLVTSNTNNSTTPEANQTKNIPSISVISRSQHGLQIGGTGSGAVNCAKATNKSQGKNDGKRPHPGLGDSIVPSKKVIKQYNNTKTKNLP